jgi:hypothetical protein
MRRICWTEGGAVRRSLAILQALAVMAALTVAGCAGEGDTGGAAAELSPAELGRLGGRIHAEPERTAEILAEAGLTEEELAARVGEVTADPDAARAYAQGFREVAGEAPADAADGAS